MPSTDLALRVPLILDFSREGRVTASLGTSQSVSLDSGSGTGASARAVLHRGRVASVTVIAPGTDYQRNFPVTIRGSGSGAAATALTSGGQVTSIRVDDGGSGYGAGGGNQGGNQGRDWSEISGLGKGVRRHALAGNF